MAGNVGAAGWAGRVLTGLAAFAFLASGVMKLAGMAEKKDLDLIGIPVSMVFPLGILEIACALFYVFPRTAVLGAILLTGYMGGAILTHWRVGDPFFIQIILGVVVWAGIWLREPRLRALLPMRTGA